MSSRRIIVCVCLAAIVVWMYYGGRVDSDKFDVVNDKSGMLNQNFVVVNCKFDVVITASLAWGMKTSAS